jgi:serine/threonine protein kinase
VRLGINKKTQEKVAIKVIDKKSLGDKTHMIHTEVDILKRIEHSNIVLLKEMFETQSYIYLVMELYDSYILFLSQFSPALFFTPILLFPLHFYVIFVFPKILNSFLQA